MPAFNSPPQSTVQVSVPLPTQVQPRAPAQQQPTQQQPAPTYQPKQPVPEEPQEQEPQWSFILPHSGAGLFKAPDPQKMQRRYAADPLTDMASLHEHQAEEEPKVPKGFTPITVRRMRNGVPTDTRLHIKAEAGKLSIHDGRKLDTYEADEMHDRHGNRRITLLSPQEKERAELEGRDPEPYSVHIDKNGNVQCSCPGFAGRVDAKGNAIKGYGYCKHADAFKGLLQAGVIKPGDLAKETDASKSTLNSEAVHPLLRGTRLGYHLLALKNTYKTDKRFQLLLDAALKGKHYDETKPSDRDDAYRPSGRSDIYSQIGERLFHYKDPLVRGYRWNHMSRGLQLDSLTEQAVKKLVRVKEGAKVDESNYWDNILKHMLPSYQSEIEGSAERTKGKKTTAKITAHFADANSIVQALQNGNEMQQQFFQHLAASVRKNMRGIGAVSDADIVRSLVRHYFRESDRQEIKNRKTKGSPASPTWQQHHATIPWHGRDHRRPGNPERFRRRYTYTPKGWSNIGGVGDPKAVDWNHVRKGFDDMMAEGEDKALPQTAYSIAHHLETAGFEEHAEAIRKHAYNPKVRWLVYHLWQKFKPKEQGGAPPPWPWKQYQRHYAMLKPGQLPPMPPAGGARFGASGTPTPPPPLPPTNSARFGVSLTPQPPPPPPLGSASVVQQTPEGGFNFASFIENLKRHGSGHIDNYYSHPDHHLIDHWLSRNDGWHKEHVRRPDGQIERTYFANSPDMAKALVARHGLTRMHRSRQSAVGSRQGKARKYSEEEFHRAMEPPSNADPSIHMKYADWLEEQGMGGVAKIIRLHHEQAHPVHGVGPIFIPKLGIRFNKWHAGPQATFGPSRYMVQLIRKSETSPESGFAYRATLPTKEAADLVHQLGTEIGHTPPNVRQRGYDPGHAAPMRREYGGLPTRSGVVVNVWGSSRHRSGINSVGRALLDLAATRHASDPLHLYISAALQGHTDALGYADEQLKKYDNLYKVYDFKRLMEYIKSLDTPFRQGNERQMNKALFRDYNERVKMARSTNVFSQAKTPEQLKGSFADLLKQNPEGMPRVQAVQHLADRLPYQGPLAAPRNQRYAKAAALVDEMIGAGHVHQDVQRGTPGAWTKPIYRLYHPEHAPQVAGDKAYRDMASRVIEMAKAGQSLEQTSAELGISKRTVAQIRRRGEGFLAGRVDKVTFERDSKISLGRNGTPRRYALDHEMVDQLVKSHNAEHSYREVEPSQARGILADHFEENGMPHQATILRNTRGPIELHKREDGDIGVNFRKVVHLGTADRRAIVVTIENRKDGQLGIRGRHGRSGYGQIDMHLRNAPIKPAKGWTQPMIRKLFDVWHRWHLNDMKAGSPAQEEYLRQNPMPEGYNPNYHSNVRAKLTEAGLQPDPNYLHEGKPYSYGSAWLKEEVPLEVLSWLAQLPSTDRDV